MFVYVYLYCHPQRVSCVESLLFNVSRQDGRFKIYLKPV